MKRPWCQCRRCGVAPYYAVARRRRIVPCRCLVRAAVRAARLRHADRNRLLRRASAMLPLTNVMHLLADELAGLRGCRLAGALVGAGAPQRLFFGHGLPSGRSRHATRVPWPLVRFSCEAATTEARYS